MNDYIVFMHADARAPGHPESGWAAYVATLRAAGAFQGGSAIGGGICVSKTPSPVAIAQHISGYIRIRAASLAAAQALLAGNPVYEAGGTVEIRELPTSG